MHWTDALLPPTRHHYSWLDEAIRGLDLAQARFELGAGRPSIAWIVGHVATVSDSVAEAVAGIGRLRPELEARRGDAHYGVQVEADWRALAREWAEVSRRTLAGLERLDDAVLESAPATTIHPEFAERLETRHAFWSGHVFHVAYHLGQIGLLRGALGLGWAGA